MKKILLTVCLISSSLLLFAQENTLKNVPAFARQRFYLGGGGGLSFGDITDIEVSPLVGYRVTDRFSVGVQFSYTYLNERLYDPYTGQHSGNYVTHFIGEGAYARYYIFNNIFAHVQYEINNLEAAVPNDPLFPTAYTYKRVDVPSLLVGGGYRQPLGDKSAFTILVLYDVLQNPYSPYAGSPFIIRAGVNFGL